MSPQVVRYYVRRGLLKPARHPQNGYKLFTGDDVRRLLFIHQAKALAFTLSEIADILGLSDHGKSPCPRAREIIRRHIKENGRKLEELSALQVRIEKALDQWQQMPDRRRPAIRSAPLSIHFHRP